MRQCAGVSLFGQRAVAALQVGRALINELEQLAPVFGDLVLLEAAITPLKTE